MCRPHRRSGRTRAEGQRIPACSKKRASTRSESKYSSAIRRAAAQCRRSSRAISAAPAAASSSVRNETRPSPTGRSRAEAGVLHERGPAGGQVARGAVAEPAAPRLDVDALRDRELGARAAARSRGSASGSPATRGGSTSRQPCSRRTPRSASSPGGCRARSRSRARERGGSSTNLRNSCDLEAVASAPRLDRPVRPAPARDGREAGRSRPRRPTGQSSSTTGWRIGASRSRRSGSGSRACRCSRRP